MGFDGLSGDSIHANVLRRATRMYAAMLNHNLGLQNAMQHHCHETLGCWRTIVNEF